MTALTINLLRERPKPKPDRLRRLWWQIKAYVQSAIQGPGLPSGERWGLALA